MTTSPSFECIILVGLPAAGKSTFAAAAGSLPKTLPAAARNRLSAALLDATTRVVLPAYRDFGAFLETEYAGKAREEVGVHATPGGREAYAFLVRSHTTTDLSPLSRT